MGLPCSHKCVHSPCPAQAIQTISTVKLSGKRLLQLINDILDAAKMKQGILVIKHENVRRVRVYCLYRQCEVGCIGRQARHV